MMGKGHGMKRQFLGMMIGIAAAFLISACQPTQPELPTMAALPTDIPTDIPTDTPPPATDTATELPSATEPPTATHTQTPMDTPTREPSATTIPSRTPFPTITRTPIPTEGVDPASVRVLTATAAIIQAPTLATLTPIPAGAQVTARPTSTGTPLVTADVIITEAQFQEQLELMLADNPAVDSLEVDFKTDGIVITMTARGGAAFSSGTVLFGLQILEAQEFNRALVMTIEDISMQGGGEIPEEFFEVATGDLYVSLYDALDATLDQRLGRDDHDLENLTLTETTMDVFLYVPR
jgi:hypothetical protein